MVPFSNKQFNVFLTKKILKRGTSTKNKTIKSLLTTQKKRGDAEEACWAHNPEVGGSKPSLAKLKHDVQLLSALTSNKKILNGVAQRKRVGPITQRSEDRNLLPLI